MTSKSGSGTGSGTGTGTGSGTFCQREKSDVREEGGSLYKGSEVSAKQVNYLIYHL